MRENLSKAGFEGLSASNTTRQEEAKKIVEEINDPRLRADYDLEYFTIHTKGRVRHIPKRRIGEDPDRVNGEIVEWLKKELADLDNQQENQQ